MSNQEKHQNVSRRKFIAGAGGAVLSLPWLESVARAEESQSPAQRMAFFYLPNGITRRGFFPGGTPSPFSGFQSKTSC